MRLRFSDKIFPSNLANWFFSDKRKLYTKQKGCHGVGERVGQNLELYIYVLKKNIVTTAQEKN